MKRYEYINPRATEGETYGDFIVYDRSRGRGSPLARCEDGDDARLITDLLNAHTEARDKAAQHAVEGAPV